MSCHQHKCQIHIHNVHGKIAAIEQQTKCLKKEYSEYVAATHKTTL